MSTEEPGAAPQPAAGNGGPPLLEVEDIHTFYGSIEALKGISISVTTSPSSTVSEIPFSASIEP